MPIDIHPSRFTESRPRSRYAEPYTCSNPNCNTTWENQPELDRCHASDRVGSAGCEVTCCPDCVKTCTSCGDKFCAQHIVGVDYGNGQEWNCPGCLLDAQENLGRCSHCEATRSDLHEVSDDDQQLICRPCAGKLRRV